MMTGNASLVRSVFALFAGIAAVIALLILLPQEVGARRLLADGDVHHFEFREIGTQTAGVGFTVVITAVDSGGTRVISYTESVTLSLSTGGTISPTATGVFSGGVRTETVTITQAAENVEIMAQDGPITGTSDPFTVETGDLHHVLIRTAPDGGGDEADTLVMTTDDEWDLYAAGYDAYTNYVGPVTVTWSVSELYDPIGTLSPASGISTTLDATTPGEGQVKADHATAEDDTTGIIEVSVGDVDKVVIQEAPGDGEAEAGDYSMTTDDEWDLYAAGYDADLNYVGLVTVTWSVSELYDPIGTLSPASGISTTLDATTPGDGWVVATYDDDTSDTVGPVTVNAGDVDKVVIQEAPGDGVGEAFDHEMTTDDEWELYAAGYDADLNYVGLVTVTWSVSELYDPIGTLSPASGISTTLDATTPGEGRVRADHVTAEDDTTGIIEVSVGDVDKVVIQEAPGDGEAEAGDYSMTTDDEWDLYAAGYDADLNYLGLVTVTWSVSELYDPIGTLSPASGISTKLDATTPGEGQVRADHATAEDDTTGIISVEPGALASFTFDNIASPQTAGEPFEVKITALDGEGNVKTDHAGSAVLTDTTGTISPVEVGPFSAGVWTDTVTITKTVTSGTITVTDGIVTGTSNAFTVIPAPLDYIAISPTESTILAGAQQEYTAAAFDRFGNLRGDVTAETDFRIKEEEDHGGTWTDNTYTSANYGTWTVRGEYTPDPREELESDEATLIVLDTDLRFSKTDSRELVNAGDMLTYELTYGNSGNEEAVGIVITDTLPNYVQYVDDSCQIDAGTCSFDEDSRVVVFSGITIPAGGERQASLKVRVLDPLPAGAQFVRNRASLTSPSSEVPFTVQDVDTIETRPDLAVAVAHAPRLFSPGKVMTFTVAYSNTGKMHAQGVVISATLPTGTTPTTETQAIWNSSDGVTYTYLVGGDGELLARDTGGSVPFAVQHPEQPEVGAPRFSSRFSIAADAFTGGEADPGNNTVDHVVGVPDLTITNLEVDPWPVVPDLPVVFTITVKNQGTGWALNPDNEAGFWGDIFLTATRSYPRDGDNDKTAVCPPLAPGAEFDLRISEVYPWDPESKGPIIFTPEEVADIVTFYAKIDNYYEAEGLVPEYNERNNVWPAPSNRVYLPLVARGQ